MKAENQNEFLGELSQKEKEHQTSAIKTIVKVRPMLPSESKESCCISCTQNTLQINGGYYHTIKKKLDRVFGSQSTQIDLYQYIAGSVAKAIEGYNVTVFSYGQTGSGKTYTMFGSDWDNMISRENLKPKQNTFYQGISQDVNFAGIIPRCIDQLFNKLISKKKRNVTVYCSFLQLYNQRLIDLLAEGDAQPLVIHQNKEDGIYVEGLTEHKVKSALECMGLMQKGQRSRVVRQTSMNIKSSRSHTLFQLLIEEVFPSTQSFRRSKINLCDLAGSEKINKSEQIQLQHLKQLKNINLSLTTLGKVIHSLSSNKALVAAYRQSKLTRLLQDSLGGNTFTIVIANINCKESCIEETLNTLKFIQRARQVVTEVSIKTYENQPEIKQLQQEVNYLKGILKIKRRGTAYHSSSGFLQQKVHRLQFQNKKLKQTIDRESDKSLISRLLEENSMMKRELERRGQEKGSHHVSSIDIISDDVTRYKRPASEIDSNSNTSHTVEKGVCSRSRYSNYSGLSKRFGTVPMDQNLIVKRLQRLEQIKLENRQKLKKQLKDLQRSQQLTVNHLRGTSSTSNYNLTTNRRSFKK